MPRIGLCNLKLLTGSTCALIISRLPFWEILLKARLLLSFMGLIRSWLRWIQWLTAWNFCHRLVFHVGLHKPYMVRLPPLLHLCRRYSNVRYCQHPQHARHARGSPGVCQILVQWAGQPPSEAFWEDGPSFRQVHHARPLESRRIER